MRWRPGPALAIVLGYFALAIVASAIDRASTIGWRELALLTEAEQRELALAFRLSMGELGRERGPLHTALLYLGSLGAPHRRLAPRPGAAPDLPARLPRPRHRHRARRCRLGSRRRAARRRAPRPPPRGRDARPAPRSSPRACCSWEGRTSPRGAISREACEPGSCS
ncbi:MAG: hypothetical protein M5U28_47820 [Sandaracinaceae bacterium]|nr:hypothetical protein [Sandaracinaceae bacterium]